MDVPLLERWMNTAQIKRNYLVEPGGLRFRSSKLFISVTVGIGLFTDLFLYTLFVPILPFMLSDRAGVPPDQIQSNVSRLLAAYAGASVIASPIIGIVTDRLGMRRAPFLCGLAILFLATLLLLLSRTVELMLLARVLQGISASVVWTNGLALCLETVGAEGLGKAIGSIFGCISIGNLLAPTLGGILYQSGGLEAVFALAFAMLVVDFTMRVLVIEVKVARLYEAKGIPSNDAHSSPNNASVDRLDEDEADESTQLLLRRPSSDSPYKFSDTLPRVAHIMPILPCMTDTHLVAALSIAFVQAVLLGSIDATVPAVSQDYFGLTPFQSGLMFLPIGVANLTFGPFLGWCVDRLGSKKVAVIVYLYLVPVLVSFRLVAPGGAHNIAVYATLLGLAGSGIAGMGAPSVVEASTVVQKYHQANLDFFGEHGPYAQLYSFSYLFFSLGLTVGPELAGGLRQTVGYGNMNAVLAIICAVTACICLLFLGERKSATAQNADA